jgi:hypothetical protein
MFSRIARSVLLTVGLAAGSLVAAQAPAQAAIVFGDVTIAAGSTFANVQIGGFLDGVVYLDHSGVNYATSNLWNKSTDSYIGPGGYRYIQYRNLLNNRCLSHDGALLMSVPCVWSDNSQWWAVQDLHLGSQPCPPSIPDCLPIAVVGQFLRPWDDWTKVATMQDDLLVLNPPVGATGSTAQHLHVFHAPALPH